MLTRSLRKRYAWPVNNAYPAQPIQRAHLSSEVALLDRCLHIDVNTVVTTRVVSTYDKRLEINHYSKLKYDAPFAVPLRIDNLTFVRHGKNYMRISGKFGGLYYWYVTTQDNTVMHVFVDDDAEGVSIVEPTL